MSSLNINKLTLDPVIFLLSVPLGFIIYKMAIIMLTPQHLVLRINSMLHA